jgi:glucose/arabinose dehydrogenase
MQAATAQLKRRWRFPAVEFTAIAVIAILLVACVLKGRGLKTRLIRLVYPAYKARPAVVSSRPADFESNVPLDAFVACEVYLPFDGRSVDGHTLPPERPDTVRLVRFGDRRPVPSNVNTTGAGDAIVLKPLEPLEPNTQYSFEVTPGVADTGGTPFVYYSARFTTVATSNAESFPAAFEKVALSVSSASGDRPQIFTCLAIGPDHRLYVSAFDGRILRFDIDPHDGTLGKPVTIHTLIENSGGPRLITGITFDPMSTADEPILWISHGQLATEQSDDWTGKISRMSGRELKDCQDVVVNLPRAAKDHLNNQPVFGPDGALYFAQASNTAMGAPDSVWSWRPERLLSAALLRLDVSKLDPPARPLNVKTEDGYAYDPFAPGAPLTLYATGIRNGFDLLFHSNGKLYAPINGSASGGNTPASDSGPKDARRIDTGKPYDGPSVPGLQSVQQTEDDTLLVVERGAYYGHPNPLRGEFVLDGGNPTAGRDPHEIRAYPVGTMPDVNYRRSFSFGAHLAPTGIIEYKSAGPLQGKILVTRYSGGDDVIVLSPDGNGEIAQALTGIDGLAGFKDPLDLVEDTRNGNLYVIEFGAQPLTLVRPIPGGTSKRVYRQVVPQPTHALAN